MLLAGFGGALGGLGGLAGGLIGGSIIGRFLEMLREPEESLLAGNINDMLRSNGKQMISNMVSDEANSFLDKKVCALQSHEEQFDQVTNTVESIYCTVIKEHFPRILDSIDLSKTVRECINEMDIRILTKNN